MNRLIFFTGLGITLVSASWLFPVTSPWRQVLGGLGTAAIGVAIGIGIGR